LKLKKNTGPKKLGEELTALTSRYNCKLDKEQKIATVVNAAGREYAETIRQETLILGINHNLSQHTHCSMQCMRSGEVVVVVVRMMMRMNKMQRH